MAKADLEFPISGLHGRLTNDSEFYCANRLGKTVVSNYPKRQNSLKTTDNQRLNRSRFQQAVLAAQAELADPVRRAHWQSLFDSQPAPHRYKILRNFVIAQIARNLRTESAA